MAVPPVANKSSMIKTFFPFSTASVCTCMLVDPYSKSKSSNYVSRGNLFGFRKGTNPAPIS